MRISDWSSDVCSADLCHRYDACGTARSCWPELSVTEDPFWRRRFWVPISVIWARALLPPQSHWRRPPTRNCWYRSRWRTVSPPIAFRECPLRSCVDRSKAPGWIPTICRPAPLDSVVVSVTQFHAGDTWNVIPERSEEHTSDLQSLMRISYAVFC